MSYPDYNKFFTIGKNVERVGRSTVTAVECLVMEIYNAFKGEELVLLTLCGLRLSKAFDCVSHKILLIEACQLRYTGNPPTNDSAIL